MIIISTVTEWPDVYSIQSYGLPNPILPMAQNQGKQVLANLSTFPIPQRKMPSVKSFVQKVRVASPGMLFIVVCNGGWQKEVS